MVFTEKYSIKDPLTHLLPYMETGKQIKSSWHLLYISILWALTSCTSEFLCIWVKCIGGKDIYIQLMELAMSVFTSVK